ncbi:MAG: hypothetical protein KDC07_08910, partial [Chitinophagaceae bacterium]|nr:hypothetical protein [Chitinophagaceae bacterium]
DGLSDNWIGQMAFLPDGKIAVATNMGLNLFTMPGDLSRLENMTLLGNRTGYPVTDVNAAQTSLFVDSKGIIWLCCSYEGTSLLRYDPSALDNDSTQPNVIIKSVLINEEAVSWSSLLPIQEATENTTPAFAMEEADIYGGELSQPERDSLRKKYTGVKFDSLSDFYHVPQNLELPYQHNHITIRFNAIQPGRPQRVRYRYMLEGYDKNWGPVTQNTGAVFGHIREGKYTFKVKAQSADGVWSEPLEYTFSVLPPWYRTWWMYTTYVLLFLSGLRIFSKWRERSLMADNEKLEKTVKERTKEIAEEKKKSDDLLLNILPEEVADELKERGATTAQQYDHVTVLFTDFVNFTTAGEHMGSQALVEELHNCFKAFDEILDKYNIEKIKTIGDAYLAVCGLPTADQRHAEKIVQAAQEIRAFMLQRRQQLGDKTFEIRIGIHSGSVVAGIVGVKKFAYDIWGDTVNTAARMEQNSEAGKINISQTTYELVQDNFTCSYRGEIEAKGKGELKMYFVE